MERIVRRAHFAFFSVIASDKLSDKVVMECHKAILAICHDNERLVIQKSILLFLFLLWLFS